jgi:predicted DNA-binding transcriptional regulator AlpA
MHSDTFQPLLDAYGLADYLGLASHRSVYKLVEEMDGFPVVRVGRRLRFDIAEVREYLEDQGAER